MGKGPPVPESSVLRPVASVAGGHSVVVVDLKRDVERAFTGAHRRVFDLTKGRVAGRAFGMPVVKLTTVGRKSGQLRDTMLTSPLHDEGRIVLVASANGAPHHPSWYLNLCRDPHVIATLSGRSRPMVARTASEEEKAQLWPQIVATYEGYAGYQAKTDRDIPVVILEPA